MLSCYLRSMETLQSAPDPKDLTLSIDERRELIVWAADCMYRILPIFEKQYPADPRLRPGPDDPREGGPRDAPPHGGLSAQGHEAVQACPGLVHEARAAGWRQRQLSARSFYHTRAPGSTGWSPRRRQEEAGTKAVTPVLLAPISMSSKTHVCDSAASSSAELKFLFVAVSKK